MPHLIHCTTGKVLFEVGGSGLYWCQDCNGHHYGDDQGISRTRSIRTVAFMLRNDEITPKDAALTLLQLTEAIEEKQHIYHD